MVLQEVILFVLLRRLRQVPSRCLAQVLGLVVLSHLDKSQFLRPSTLFLTLGLSHTLGLCDPGVAFLVEKLDSA